MGSHVSLESGGGITAEKRRMRAYILFACAVFMAGWLLFWLGEALNPERLGAINTWAIENGVLAFGVSGSGEIPDYFPEYITYGSSVYIPRGNKIWSVDLAPPLGP
jgi:hypothetical protein